MPEPTQLIFSHHEVVTALLKAQAIHDGIWGLAINFGIRGMNVGATEEDLQPTALVGVLGIGLQRFDKVSNVALDAAVANPATGARKLIGTGKTKAAKKK